MNYIEELGKWVDEQIAVCEKRMAQYSDVESWVRLYSDRKTTLLEVKGKILCLVGLLDD